MLDEAKEKMKQRKRKMPKKNRKIVFLGRKIVFLGGCEEKFFFFLMKMSSFRKIGKHYLCSDR